MYDPEVLVDKLKTVLDALERMPSSCSISARKIFRT